MMRDVTRLLGRVESGDPGAAEELLPLVYDELRKLAAAKLAQEKPGQTLQPTALVHEAFLRLVSTAQPQGWDGRGHFFAAAAEAMRRILIDSVRRKLCVKRGGERERVELDDACWDAVATMSETRREEMLAVDAALDELAAAHPDEAELVKLRYFAGFSVEETADLLGISRATAKRRWAFARAWLRSAIRPAQPR
jgi:RNA polymerase sigma factor (TIGR02999 family)